MATVIRAEDALATIRTVEEDLEREATRLAATGDPLASSVAGYAAGVKAMRQLVTEAATTITYELREVRKPVSNEEMRRAVAQGIAAHAARLIEVMKWRTVLWAAVALVVAMMSGVGIDSLARGNEPTLIGTRAGGDQCEDRTDGSRLCWIPIWARLPKQR